MPKITGCRVEIAGTWQPMSYESVKAGVALSADLTEDANPAEAVRLLQHAARNLVEADVVDILRATERLGPDETPFKLPYVPAPELEAQPGITPTEITVTHAQTWQTASYESLREELTLFAELEEGDSAQEVAAEMLLTAKTLVRESARPALEQSGRVRTRRTEKLSGLEIQQASHQREAAPSSASVGGVQLLN